MSDDFPRYEIIAGTTADEQAVRGLARHLNTVNLPDDDDAIHDLLVRSERSFAGELQPPSRREFVFLLRDRLDGRVLGTSMIIAQLGRRDAPYIYFAVRKEEKYSATLDRLFVHTVLDTTYVYAGPTELGGLVVAPDVRGRPERFGTLISFVRLLFIRMRRADFQDEVLAELLPPFLPDGRSALWEAVGRRFTGMPYAEADRLSRSNKEFIRGLFPDSVYATLLSRKAQKAIGQVGEQTQAVARLLQRIGFRYAERVDPFDGGPHFLASTDEVTLVQQSARLDPSSLQQLRCQAMVGAELGGWPYFRAVPVPAGQDFGRVDMPTIAAWLGERCLEQAWILRLM